MSSGTQASGEQERDSADLARFGYSQELKRSLGLFSSFAVAFSYISPSTGIFTLFAGPDHAGRGVHLDLAGGRAGPVHRGAKLRRGIEPLPGGGFGLPVDEVPGQPDLLLVHR